MYNTNLKSSKSLMPYLRIAFLVCSIYWLSICTLILIELKSYNNLRLINIKSRIFTKEDAKKTYIECMPIDDDMQLCEIEITHD